jgi:Outer membrane protein beta-barrel domain
MRAHRIGQALLMVGLLGSPIPTAAQAVALSLGTGWYDPGGDDFANTDGGIGIDAAVHLAFSERIRLGAGVQSNRHGVPFSSDDWSVWSVFLEPQLELTTGEGVTPFVAVRAAWMRQAIDVTGGERTANGVGGGALVGVRFPVASRVGIAVSAPIYTLWFGDYSVDGTVNPDTASSGQTVGLRVSVELRLGGA